MEFETWLYDRGEPVVIPFGEPSAVGELLGELLVQVHLERTTQGAPGIDYERSLLPRVPPVTTASFEPRGIVLGDRAAELSRMFWLAGEQFEEVRWRSWIDVRCPLVPLPEGGFRCMTRIEVAEKLGVDRKTIGRWVAEFDEALCVQLDKRGWKL